MRVVGSAVLPFDDDLTGVGEGLWTTFATTHSFDDRIPREEALIRLAPGIDRGAAIARLQKRFPTNEGVLDRVTPRTIQTMKNMSSLSVVFASLLAVLAAGTLAHLLVTSIRRRRRDLAILKTFGFSTGQVRSAVGWQAVVFVTFSLAIAVPLGVVAGRWTWRSIAGYGGFASAPAVPATSIALVAASALVAAVLLAALPARSAARTAPALVLRSE
jgi:putative ABC transport system permease protein